MVNLALKPRSRGPAHEGGSLAEVLTYVVALGGTEYGGPLSPEEIAALNAVHGLPTPPAQVIGQIRNAILAGDDPLGQAFCGVLSAEERRPVGAFYTPPGIVMPMVQWVLEQSPDRIVDAGAGSGRFAAAIARLDPSVEIVAVDADPVAALMCRAHLAVVGARQARVIQSDYTRLALPPASGRTAFIGNPPYVRHHVLTAEQKAWAKTAAAQLGFRLSGLAGLHVFFFLATALMARKGDVGCFVTSAEWLTVGYGSALRELLASKLGVASLHRLNPSELPFADAMTTALITCFRVGSASRQVRLHVVDEPANFARLNGSGTSVARKLLKSSGRWDVLFPEGEGSTGPFPRESGRLGDLVRVSRGVATGANRFFVMRKEEAAARGLSMFARPAITEAQEIFSAGGTVRDTSDRLVLINLPPDLDLSAPEQESVRRYVEEGERLGYSARYLCRHRKPWWSLRLKPAPPIIATYMARQAPAFTLNPDALVLLNVAHGLYPRVELSPLELQALVKHLNASRDSFRGSGRTYQGGLEKFEPREMESLPAPARATLAQLAKEMLDGVAAFSQPATLERGTARG